MAVPTCFGRCMWQAPLQSPVAAAEAHNKCLVVCMAASLRQLRPRCCATMFDRACPVRFAKNWLHGCHASSLPVRQLASTHMHTPLTSCTCSICDALVSSIANPHLTCFTHPSGLCMPPPPSVACATPAVAGAALPASACAGCLSVHEKAGISRAALSVLLLLGILGCLCQQARRRPAVRLHMPHASSHGHSS